MKQVTITLTEEEQAFLVDLLKKSPAQLHADHICGECDSPIHSFFPDASRDGASFPCVARPNDGHALLEKLSATPTLPILRTQPKPEGTIVLKGEFNGCDVEVEIYPARHDDPEAPEGTYDLGDYPELMNWTNAMEVVCANGYRRRRDGLIERVK